MKKPASYFQKSLAPTKELRGNNFDIWCLRQSLFCRVIERTVKVIPSQAPTTTTWQFTEHPIAKRLQAHRYRLRPLSASFASCDASCRSGEDLSDGPEYQGTHHYRLILPTDSLATAPTLKLCLQGKANASLPLNPGNSGRLSVSIRLASIQGIVRFHEISSGETAGISANGSP